jgi:hypothetical protein
LGFSEHVAVVTCPEQSNQAEENPNRRGNDRDARENVTGFRAERARAAHAAQRAGQAATAATLHEHEQNQEDCQERQQQCE